MYSHMAAAHQFSPYYLDAGNFGTLQNIAEKE